jgi:hypothetical protein
MFFNRIGRTFTAERISFSLTGAARSSSTETTSSARVRGGNAELMK